MALRTIVRLADQAAGFLTNSSASTTYQAKVANVSDAEIGYLDGVTSGIQSQIDSKLSTSSASTIYAPITPTTQTGFRNFVINGDFRINQRNGTNQVVDPIALSKYVTDHWACYRASYATGARYQTVDVDTTLLSGVSLEAARFGRVNATTGTSIIAFRQSIEIINIGHTVGKTMTLSFYARAGAGFSSSGLALSSNIQEDTVEYGPGSAATSPVNSTQVNTLTTTWQRFTQTFTRDTTRPFVQIGFQYTPVGTATSTDHVEITGVQLELGSVATPFENRPYGTELALCQRYHYRVTPTVDGQWLTGFGTARSTTEVLVPVFLPVTMRTIPTFTGSQTAVADTFNTRIVATTGVISSAQPNIAGLSLGVTGAVQYRPYVMINNSGQIGTSFMAFDAEL